MGCPGGDDLIDHAVLQGLLGLHDVIAVDIAGHFLHRNDDPRPRSVLSWHLSDVKFSIDICDQDANQDRIKGQGQTD